MWPFNNMTNESENTDNPYVIGPSVGNSPAFVGREDVLQEVHQVLQNQHQGAIVLYGQRRIGKTSILRELEAQLAQAGYLPIFFDLQDKGKLPLTQVNQELANKISDKLNTQSKRALGEIFSDWQSPKTLVILFDEFEAFAGNEFEERQASDTFFRYWQDILAQVDKAKLNFVFTVGRKVEDLNDKAISLLKTIPSQKVSLLAQDATFRLIRLSDSENNQTLKWNEEAIKAVWAQTGGHPFMTQIVCYCIWNYLYEPNPRRKPTVRLTDINENLLAKALETGENAFQWLWSGLPDTEKLVTSILARTGNKPITEQTVEQLLKNNGLRIRQEEQQKATDVLTDWDVIEDVAGDQFRFRVELFRRWIAKNKPLSKVQQELDSRENKAHNFYNLGRHFRALNQLKDAIDSLEKAVKLNPKHVSANALITQTYIDQQYWEPAWETAKALSLLRPLAARPLLNQALEGLIAGQDEDTQLRYYEETLEIESEDSEVKQQWQTILRQRGDNAYFDGNLDDALEAYQKAGLSEKVALVKGDKAYQAGDLEKALEFYKEAKSDDKIAEIEQLFVVQRKLLNELVEQSKEIDAILLYDAKRNKVYHNQNSMESHNNLSSLKIVFQNLLPSVENLSKMAFTGQFQHAIFPFVKGSFLVYFVDELPGMIGFVSRVNMGTAISASGRLLKRLMAQKEQLSVFF
jgi:tetratricopeptide (TPR) repeat protein